MGRGTGKPYFLDDSKTGARTVFLCTQARDILANIKRGKANELVFKGQYGSRIDIDNYWQTIRGKAKLRSVRIHDIRHSYASQAARLSLPLPTIQRLLGHAQLESTARYTHFDDSHLAKIAQQISDLIEKAQ